jgi:hypothetical protein
MGSLLAGRRRQILRNGKIGVLQRPNADTVSDPISVSLKVFKLPYVRRPTGQEEGNPNDGQAETLADEMTSAGWPVPPLAGDQLVFDNRTWIVIRSDAVYEGETVIGYSMWIRGGV